MARFVGRFEHNLDDKGRLILPSAFRPKLADGAFVAPLGNCLALMPTDEFDRTADRLEAQVAAGEVQPSALRIFASEADEVQPDSQGRIRLREELRSTAGIEGQVLITGALRRIELWNPARWEELAPEGREKLMDAIERGHGFGPVGN